MKQIKLSAQIHPIIIKKSKFIGSAGVINNEKEAVNFIKKIKSQHPKANHNCWAYRIKLNNGILIKSSDDGEPSGTAGKIILYVMEKQDIINSIIVVTRYFGGIKLGKGGLVRSYSKITTEIIKKIGINVVDD